MGKGGGGDGGAAKRARYDEMMRKRRITEGQGRIDQAFAGYDDAYYNNYANEYSNHYTQELDQKYAQGVDELTAALASRGVLESSYGAAQLAKLAEALGDQRTQVTSQARDSANSLRGKMEAGKSDLYSLNQSAADPAAINSRALASAGTFVAPQSFSPLGNVFASVLDPVIGYRQAQNNSAAGTNRQAAPNVFVAGQQGSGQIVG